MKRRDIAVIAAGAILIIAISIYAILSNKKNDIIIVYNSTAEKYQTEPSTEPVVITQPITQTSVIQAETTVSKPLYLNINTATKEELILLNGIGEAFAERIITYRNTYGDFRNTEEIMNVYGIGEKLYEVILPYIYVENPVYPEATTAKTPVVTTKTETKPPQTEIVTEPFSEIFDLNTVTFKELMLIPDMKEEHALKIIELREQIGSYSHIYEILYIEGISRDTASEYMKHLEIVE